jgi:hypothetical protein
MRATKVTFRAGPEILHENRSLKYIPLLFSNFFFKRKTTKWWPHEPCLAFGLMVTTDYSIQLGK